MRVSLMRYFFGITAGEINELAWKDIVEQVTKI